MASLPLEFLIGAVLTCIPIGFTILRSSYEAGKLEGKFERRIEGLSSEFNARIQKVEGDQTLYASQEDGRNREIERKVQNLKEQSGREIQDIDKRLTQESQSLRDRLTEMARHISSRNKHQARESRALSDRVENLEIFLANKLQFHIRRRRASDRADPYDYEDTSLYLEEEGDGRSRNS